jgi:hypothetical protein
MNAQAVNSKIVELKNELQKGNISYFDYSFEIAMLHSQARRITKVAKK